VAAVRRSGQAPGLLAAALAAAALSIVPVRAAEICEGCWEVGGRGAALIPGDEGGLEPTWGVGAFATFHFRPYWSAGFSLDRYPGSIEDGPDETLTLLMVRGALTFRAEREQRTRPYGFFGAGVAYDHVAAEEVTIATQTGPVSARTQPDSDTGVAYCLGAGGHTALGSRTWLRYEGQWTSWSTFGIAPDALRLVVTLTRRLGR
jgi:hypothetical protein